MAGPGTNLLLNPGAQAGAVSAEGWDAVTIPGWQVSSGLPTVVPYGAPHLSRATGQEPAVHGGSLFAGGAGGTARLTQAVSLRQETGPPVATGTRYRLSGWLGGTATSRAAVTVAFLSAAGAVLARRAISHGRGNDRLAYRAAAGTLPPGTASARVTLVLATSLTNDDGPNAPLVGYDRAVADGLRFSVSAPVRRPPPLTPPPAHVPRYQHVFLFYFENEDLGSVLGNTKQAPFLNSLVPHSSVLANFFAEEHPSDANYLALAGGSAFGVPLTDPLEANPQYTIHARNIGDLIGARHETWKTYLQSANGPCDDTVHRYYWNDDEPMTYFADVRLRPAYCAAHLAPLPALRTDLASAATTPNFAWLAPDDCADMEGCGIKAGDQFLQTELGAIMRSPAWRTQRSLAIITFDEDDYDHEHPAQRVLTLMLGSGVRQGYVSHVRYTHYSLLRTIEGALGLGTLTRNDRYAQPVNDVFSHGPAAPAPAGGRDRSGRDRRADAGQRGPRPAAGTRAAHGRGRAAASDRLRGELRRHGHAHRPDGPAGGQADQGRREPAGHRHHPGRPDRLRRQLRLGLGHADQDRQPAGGRADPGREAAVGDRHHAQRQDRLRRQLRLGHGHAHQHQHPAGGRADPGREAAAGDRHHAQRQDRLRAGLGGRRGDADQHRHQPAARRSRSGATPSRSRSRRTAGPPTSPTTARTRSPRSAPPPAARGRPSRPARRPIRSPSRPAAPRSS